MNNSTVGEVPEVQKIEAIIVPIVIGLIVALGLVGNGCIIGAVLRYKAMRSAPNIFIVNIAVGDIILNVISFPTGALNYSLDSYVYGAAFCKIGNFLATLTLGLSIFTLTALSIDRVLVISQSLKLWQKATTRIITMVVAVWILAILAAIPDAVSYYLASHEYDGVVTLACRPAPPEWQNEMNYMDVYSVVYIILFFCIPFVIIAICYGVMAYVMVKSSHNLPGEGSENCVWRLKQIRMRKKVAKIMVVLIVLFFICWLPRSVLIIYKFHHPNFIWTLKYMHAQIFALVLAAANGCVNPIALFFLSKSFKTHFKKQLCCGRKTLPSTESDLGTAPDDHPMSKLLKSRHRGDQAEETDVTALDQA